MTASELLAFQDHFLRRAALLGNGCEFRFRSDGPSFFVSNKRLLLEAIDGQQPPSSFEFDLEFTSKSTGCFVQDILLDTGRPPYVHQAVTVAVVPEKHKVFLKALMDAFERLSQRDIRAIGSALPDGLLTAARNILLRPPVAPDDYKEQLHSAVYVEEVFRHFQ